MFSGFRVALFSGRLNKSTKTSSSDIWHLYCRLDHRRRSASIQQQTD
jgi:hypothetical protein